MDLASVLHHPSEQLQMLGAHSIAGRRTRPIAPPSILASWEVEGPPAFELGLTV